MKKFAEENGREVIREGDVESSKSYERHKHQGQIGCFCAPNIALNRDKHKVKILAVGTYPRSPSGVEETRDSGLQHPFLLNTKEEIVNPSLCEFGAALNPVTTQQVIEGVSLVDAIPVCLPYGSCIVEFLETLKKKHPKEYNQFMAALTLYYAEIKREVLGEKFDKKTKAPLFVVALGHKASEYIGKNMKILSNAEEKFSSDILLPSCVPGLHRGP